MSMDSLQIETVDEAEFEPLKGFENDYEIQIIESLKKVFIIVVMFIYH